MECKVVVYYDDMEDCERVFTNKNDAINELHRLGLKYRNAKKYKVEMVECGFTNYQEIDGLINGFIEENPQIEIIDIKYQSNISSVADGGVSATYYHTSALIIYKELD